MQSSFNAVPQGIKTLSIAIIGDEGVGKKSFIESLTMKQNEDVKGKLLQQINNANGSMASINIHTDTNNGPFEIRFHYVKSFLEKGQESESESYQVSNSPEVIQRAHEIFNLCEFAFLLFDVTSRQSYKNIPLYYRQWIKCKDVNYSAPCLLVGTKVDMKTERKIKPKMITFHRKKNIQFYEVSSLMRYNILKPIEYSLKKVEQNIELKLTNTQSLFLPRVESSEFDADIAVIEKDYEIINQPILPESDDDL